MTTTSAGADVHLIKDLNPGPYPSDPGGQVSWGGRLLFDARDSRGSSEPWITDGTSTGTVQLATNHGFCQFFPLGARALLAADGTLYSTDGTPAGTTDLHVALPASVRGLSTSSRAYIETNSGLWASDGTTARTVRLQVGGRLVATLGGFALFANGSTLWKTDGSVAGTTPVYDLGVTSVGNDYEGVDAATVGGTVFFFANQNGASQLWITDGTAVGTHVVTAFDDGIYSPKAGGLTRIGSRVFFWGFSSAQGFEPWVSDGTTIGTTLLRDIELGSSSSRPYGFDEGFYELGGAAYFFVGSKQADGSTRSAFYRSSGTAAGTSEVLALGVAPQSPRTTTSFNGHLFVGTATDLWESDGTAAGTNIVAAGSFGTTAGAHWLTGAGDTLYVSGSNAAVGAELFGVDVPAPLIADAGASDAATSGTDGGLVGSDASDAASGDPHAGDDGGSDDRGATSANQNASGCSFVLNGARPSSPPTQLSLFALVLGAFAARRRRDSPAQPRSGSRSLALQGRHVKA